MKIDITKLLLLGLLFLMVWSTFFKKSDNIEIPEVKVTIPEQKGNTGKQVLKEYVPYAVYLPSKEGEVNKSYDVDEKWKKEYEKLTDSISKYKQYLEAIKIKKYEEKLIDNDTIEITGRATTRGTLLDYSVDYKIKPINFSYTPNVVVQYPKLSVGLGLEVGVPTIYDSDIIMKANLNIINKRGQELSFSYDTQKRVWLGFKKNFKIIK